jgi:hypothetical protein
MAGQWQVNAQVNAHRQHLELWELFKHARAHFDLQMEQ